MSRLNFAPLSDAFYLGSDQIKNTQEEINKLRQIISDTTLSKSPNNISKKEESSIESKPSDKQKRVGYSDEVTANFEKSTNSNNFESDILKVMQHPKFDDIVKSYIIVNRPEWVNSTLKNTEYTGNKSTKSAFGNFLKQGFGGSQNTPSSSYSSNIKNYIIFFLVSILMYIWLKKLFKS